MTNLLDESDFENFFAEPQDTDIPLNDSNIAGKPKSTFKWTPPSGRNIYIDNFAKAAKKHLDDFLRSHSTTDVDTNLSKKEVKAIQKLRRNTSIVIRPADKGGAVTILNTQDYIEEAENQLMDTKFYVRINLDPSNIFNSLCKELLDGLSSNISDTVRELIPPQPKIGYFYTLPKVHKLSKVLLNHFSCQADPGDRIPDLTLYRSQKYDN